MIKIGIITSTRAEYGLLKPVYLELSKYNNTNVNFIVTGTHLSKEYGYTIKEIISDRIKIDKRIKIIDGNKNDMSCITSNAITRLYNYIRKEKFDCMVLLGDRFETLGFAIACMYNNVPICHLYGGETTEGAIDEAIRHSITKMSYLHFTSCEEYRKRVIQLGEDPKRVFNVGSTGVENVVKTKVYSKTDISKIIGYNLDKYFLVTYHPVTLERNQNGFCELLKALESYNDYQIIFTKSNADRGGLEINKMIDKFVYKHNNSKAYFSLGTKKYFSLIKYSKAVIGNSSSGLTEVPALLVPTINVGNRQRGRVMVESIINCVDDYKSIKKAINKCLNDSINLELEDFPFYKKNSAKSIASIICKTFGKRIDLMKKFYDL